MGKFVWAVKSQSGLMEIRVITDKFDLKEVLERCEKKGHKQVTYISFICEAIY